MLHVSLVLSSPPPLPIAVGNQPARRSFTRCSAWPPACWSCTRSRAGSARWRCVRRGPPPSAAWTAGPSAGPRVGAGVCSVCAHACRTLACKGVGDAASGNVARCRMGPSRWPCVAKELLASKGTPDCLPACLPAFPPTRPPSGRQWQWACTCTVTPPPPVTGLTSCSSESGMGAPASQPHTPPRPAPPPSFPSPAGRLKVDSRVYRIKAEGALELTALPPDFAAPNSRALLDLEPLPVAGTGTGPSPAAAVAAATAAPAAAAGPPAPAAASGGAGPGAGRGAGPAQRDDVEPAVGLAKAMGSGMRLTLTEEVSLVITPACGVGVEAGGGGAGHWGLPRWCRAPWAKAAAAMQLLAVTRTPFRRICMLSLRLPGPC